jgi:hypothetical protein
VSVGRDEHRGQWNSCLENRGCGIASAAHEVVLHAEDEGRIWLDAGFLEPRKVASVSFSMKRSPRSCWVL